MRTILKISCAVSILAVFFVTSVLAEDKNPQSPTPKTAAPGQKDKRAFTHAELLEHLIGILEHERDIINLVPGLKEIAGSKDKEVSYAYQGTPIDKLDQEKLDKLYVKVQNEAVRIRTDRLNKQLESLRQSQQAIRNAQQAAQPPVIPAPPPKPPYVPPVPQNPNVIQVQNPYVPPATPQPPKTPQPQQPATQPPQPPKR